MSYRIDSRQFKAAQKHIRAVIRANEKAQYRAVNRVASKTRTAASKAIRDQVRLKARYVNENLKITQKASTRLPEAKISARIRPTRLARFGPKQVTRSAPGARGDSLRGIGPGRKQAGVSVSVQRRGRRRKMRGAFLMPLRNTNKMGVFVRTGLGRGDIRHLYGPSVDQVFRSVRSDIQPDVRRELRKEFRAQLRFAMQQARR